MRLAKWDADAPREKSQEFVQLLRRHGATFRKLPTLILFVEGAPVGVRSGYASKEQIEEFLEEYLPRLSQSLEMDDDEKIEEECVDEVDLNGSRTACDE